MTIPARDSHRLTAQNGRRVYVALKQHTPMRTNIVIDDKSMPDTLRVTGLKTKRETVDAALRTLLRLKT